MDRILGESKNGRVDPLWRSSGRAAVTLAELDEDGCWIETYGMDESMSRHGLMASMVG